MRAAAETAFEMLTVGIYNASAYILNKMEQHLDTQGEVAFFPLTSAVAIITLLNCSTKLNLRPFESLSTIFCINLGPKCLKKRHEISKMLMEFGEKNRLREGGVWKKDSEGKREL